MRVKLYAKIYDYYFYGIMSCEIGQGFTFTEADVCRRFGVSRITAAKALNLLEAEGLIKRTKKGGSTVIYDGGAKNKIKTVAVIISFLGGYREELEKGMAEALNKGVNTVFFDTGKSAEKERGILKELCHRELAGLIIEPCTRHGNIDIISRFMLKKVPVVFLDSETEGLMVPCVTSDNRAGMSAAAEYLIKKGHTDIGYYPMHLYFKTSESERFKGYCGALLHGGIPLKREYLLWADFKKGKVKDLNLLSDKNVSEFDALNAKTALQNLISRNIKLPTAVCCVNDSLAASFIEGAKMLGLAVPDDISVTGFDGGGIAARLNLTTMAQNYCEMGRQALLKLEALFKNISDNRDALVPVSIIERESVLSKSDIIT